MSGRQADAQLIQRLAVPIAQLVENGAPRRCCQCIEEIGHGEILGKSGLACQGWTLLRRGDLGGTRVVDRLVAGEV